MAGPAMYGLAAANDVTAASIQMNARASQTQDPERQGLQGDCPAPLQLPRDPGAAAGQVAQPGLGITANHLVGFQTRGRVASRDELIQRGLPAHEVDNQLVRQHEEEVLMILFRRFILFFACMTCTMTVTSFGMLVWLLTQWVPFAYYGHSDCDVPLPAWCTTLVIVLVFNTFRSTVLGRILIGHLCCWQPETELSMPPLRVRLFNALAPTFLVAWDCVGVYWASKSGTIDSPLPACKQIAPGLTNSVMGFAATNLAFTLFMFVNVLGMAHLLRMALRLGVLRSNRAAPEGTMDTSCEVVKFKSEEFQENAVCSICLDDFNDEKPIVRTRACSHTFHRACLEGWLNVNRDCPLCRQDLTATEP